MITFEFPERGPQNFFAAEGYVSINVKNGKLELEAEPDADTLHLIEKFHGQRVEASIPQPVEIKTVRAKKGEDS